MSLKVLIVEDEASIAMALAAAIAAVGHEVVAVVRTTSEALETIERLHIEVAILDTNLCGESAECVALRLRASNIPFVVVSGYSAAQVGDWIGKVPLLGKPFRTSRLIAMLFDVVRSKANAAHSPGDGPLPIAGETG